MATHVGLRLSLFICFFMCITLPYAEGYNKSMCNSSCPNSNYNLTCVEGGLINVTTVLVNINETCETEPQRNDTYMRYCETSLTEGYNHTALQQVKQNCDNKSECNLLSFVQNKMIGKVTVTWYCQANETTATQRTTVKQESHVNTTESTTESTTQQIKVRTETSLLADSSEISVFTTKICSLFPDVSTTQPDNRTFITIPKDYTSPGNITDDMFTFPMRKGAITLSVIVAIVLAVIIVAAIMKRRNHK